MDESEDPNVGRNTVIDMSSLPDIVMDLWETMLRLDPTWDLVDWLVERAGEELELAGAQLDAERCRAEQRLHRIERLEQRLSRMRDGEAVTPRDPKQRNLFDSYTPMDGRPAEAEPLVASDAGGEAAMDEEVDGPVDFEEVDDDPLLAIVREHVLQYMEESDKAPVAIEELIDEVCRADIDPTEVHEAVECLIALRTVIEIDDGIFMLTD